MRSCRFASVPFATKRCLGDRGRQFTVLASIGFTFGVACAEQASPSGEGAGAGTGVPVMGADDVTASGEQPSDSTNGTPSSGAQSNGTQGGAGATPSDDTTSGSNGEVAAGGAGVPTQTQAGQEVSPGGDGAVGSPDTPSDTQAAGGEDDVSGVEDALAADDEAPGSAAGDEQAQDDASTPDPTEPRPAFADLREAGALAGRLIGVALGAAPLASDATYRDVAAREFDYVTAENAMKWEPLAPSSDSYAWGDADAFVQFAEDNQQQIKGHTFVWYMQNPSWVSEAISADELRDAIRAHIQTTMRRYAGRVRAWDVVNEAVDTDAPTGYRENVFWEKLGPDYVEQAFHWAKEADPDTLLFYNEIGIERLGPKSDFTYRMLEDLLARGVPIDGIGFQSHVSTHRYPSEHDLRANLRRFADLGLLVNISELDVRDTVMVGSEQVRALAQRIAYQQIVASCVLEPACEAITFWGFTDNYSWLHEEGTFNPLLFTRDYQRKPAYEGVLDGLWGMLPRRGANVLRNADFDAGADQWSAASGTLSVAPAEGRSGNAACVDGRGGPTSGLVQGDLLPTVQSGGPMSFSAWVRASSESTVDASLSIEEAGSEAREFNIATTRVEAGEWRLLSGYLGLGFEGTPEALALQIHGPDADVQLCVASVALEPLSVD